ncbi:hypothetical protein AHF37_12160 [Paragonimus kellicotti]|nr:hypothetical protein AHF37_12160 [Paragonimus kellicotti]
MVICCECHSLFFPFSFYCCSSSKNHVTQYLTFVICDVRAQRTIKNKIPRVCMPSCSFCGSKSTVSIYGYKLISSLSALLEVNVSLVSR